MKNTNILSELYKGLIGVKSWLSRGFVLILALFTLTVGQMWATPSEGSTWRSASSANVYFDNTNSSYTNVSMLIGRQWNYSGDKIGSWGENFSKISGTNNLYYKSITQEHYTTFCFINASDWGWKENETVTSRLSYCTNTDTPNDDLGSNTHLYVPASGSDGASVTHTTPSSYTSLNYTQTLNQTLSTDGGSTFSTSTTAIATVKVQSKKLNGNSSTTDASGTISSGSSSTSCDAARTATVTYTVSSVATGYEFVGWYDGSTQKSTSTTYTYNATEAKTITARFKETQYSLTFSHNGHGSISVGGAVVSSGSTANVNHFTTKTLVATANTGYHFAGWTKSGSNTSAVTIGDESANGTSTTIKATNTGATITAVFEADASNYTLTFGAGSNGSVSAKNTSTEAALTSGSEYASGTGVSVTATPAAHYHLEGWYSNSELTTPFAGAGTTNPYSFSLTSNISIYAKFALNQSAITLDRNGGTAGDESVTATYGSTLPSFTAHTRSGYTLNGYFTATSGGTKIINADGTLVVSTSYADGSSQWNSDATALELHAQWTENKRDVTISAGTGGSVNKASASVGVVTTTTVIATAQPGYRFTGWTATNCNVASTSSASTTLSGNGTTGDATLVANFARTYAYLEGRMTVYNAARSTETHVGSSKGKWSESSFNIAMDYDATNHRFYRHTYKTPAELSATQTDGTAQSQWFSIARSNASGSWSGKTTYHPSSNTDLTTTGIGQKKAAQTSTTDYNYKFNSSTTDGYAILYFDEAGVWYGLEHSLIYHANYAALGTSGTAPATEYYPNGFAATAAEKGDLTMTNYTFSGWNTDEHITGTSYAVGSSITMNANKDLYAVWKRSIPMDDQDATTGVSNTVYGTYNCTTLSEYTNPEKTGYTFNGWYTQEAGGGNYVISPEKELQPGVYHWTNYDNKTNEFMRYPTSTSSLYAKWTQTVTLNANLANHGSGDNTSATIVYKATDKSSITHCTPATGYHLEGYYTAATDGVKVLNAEGAFASSAVTDYITDGKWIKAGATTLYAHYAPNTYDVILNINGATTGSNQTVVATFDAAMPTIQKTSGDAITAPSKTGYAFGGYWTNAAGTGTQYYTSGLASNHVWDVATNNTNIYAKWTPNNYTVTLDKQTGVTGYGGDAGTVANQTVTFDATPATVSGTMPTAANGYCFMGFYSETGGNGRRFIDPSGNWVAAAGDTISGGNWVKPADITLYAYYKKAEITAVALSASILDPVAAGGTGFITANPTIAPRPSGTTRVCWELLYDNNNPVEGHDAVPDADGEHQNRVKFSIAGLAAGSYKIKATLAKGSSCPPASADILDTREVPFTIASGFTVTIQYKDAAGNTIASSTTSPGKATAWTAVSAPNIIGYNFSTWVPGDGITLENAATINSNQFKASFSGTLTAQYTKKNVLYFNNTLGWDSVFVYFYKDGYYWSTDKNGSGSTEEYVKGSGAKTGMHSSSYTGNFGKMTRIEGTNIWYFDYQAAGIDQKNYITFTKDRQNGYNYFHNTEVVRLADAAHYYDKPNYLPMYVPLTTKSEIRNKTAENVVTKYYTEGYWMNYPENTGYTLHIYETNTHGRSDEIRSIPFEFSADKTMPMSITVELNANRVYGFEIHRADGTSYGNSSTMKINASGDFELSQPVWEFTTGKRAGIKTSAAGEYTFTLKYGEKSSSYYYLVGVHYPVSVGSYRLVYTDNKANLWSGNTKQSGWYHPSRVIYKNEGATDTVSFFVTKGSNPQIQIQKINSASDITSEGVITWTNVGSAVSYDSVSAAGVYNFITSQAESSLSITKVEPYTGNYYIRTDCAGSTKWSNFRSQDHQMTYSSFSESAENSFGEKFSHYFAHWCPAGTNVKFCIANDYSMCITDTLEKDVNEPYKNIATGGNLLSDNNGDATANRYSANIRFMWDRKTNKISRAYVASSTNSARLFLVLHANQTLKHDDDTDISSSSPLPSNSLLLSDKENWIYETSIKIKPGTRFKLFASYALVTPNNMDSVQFFRGAYDDNKFTSDENSVILIGGESVDYQLARIVYDFKTNRLLAAWLPSGEVDGDNAINADVMIIREHQESARCITFANSSANLSGVKTVYGVMKFNRWILNNRGGSADEDKEHARPDHIAEDLANYHAPLTIENQKSVYERRLYFISFPFNVRVGDIFGFGQYGSYWVLQYYDGLSRAKNGYWLDSKSNWKYISPTQVANGYTLEANQGYLLELNLSAMAADNTTFWSNGISTIELYFPSTVAQETLKQTNCTIPALGDEYKCTINRGTAEGDRRVKDSYWRCIGVPSYNLYNSALTDGSGNEISWKTDYTWKEDESEFPFIYMWNKADNTLTPQSTSNFTFQPMHAYLTQIKSAIVWTAVSAKPSSIVARRARKEANNEHEWRIELRQDTTFLDQTYVRMTNLEQVTDSFDFGQDLVKELNSRSNIYTFIGYEKVAANSMTVHTDQTTVIPVGANIRADGEYTFAMPEGTNGVGITLIDTEANVRTSLSALDYTVTLSAGEYTNRFFLEISPVQNTPTDIENGGLMNGENGVRKVMIDGILYIVRDGKMYDARGARVE